MCGIYGLVSSDSAAPQKTFLGLSDIEYRGYDSWGIAYFHDGKFTIKKEIGFLPKGIKFPEARVALGHTRWATHGGVTKENAHPHTDCTGKIVLVHNGIIENYEDLKKKLKGHVFKSETDTEVAAHLIEEELEKEKDLKIALGKVFQKIQGLNALVVSDGKSIVACKRGSPLVVGKLQDGFAVASDPNALLPQTRKLLFLEDDQLVSLNRDFKLLSTLDLKEIRPEFSKVPWKYQTTHLDRYKHFMLKEIFEQPKVILNIANDKNSILRVAQKIKDAYGTYFIGCGSAAYACMAGTYTFSKFTKKHVNFSIGSEFSYIQDFLTSRSLLIAVSQSGETIDVVEPVGMAKEKGVKIVSITNTLGSTLYRMSDSSLLLQAGVEKAVASTKALTAMFSEMIMLAFSVSGEIDMGSKVLQESVKEVEGILKRKETIKKLADKIYKKEHIYTLGRGLSYPVALESALKIKETSYIHAEGIAAGELKHGMIALIEKGTPVIVFNPNDETKNAVLANAMEVKARGAFVIGVAPEKNLVYDFFFQVRDCGASSIIPSVVFAQLLAYYLTLKKKLNPDKPRNLAKSVVVK